MKAMVALPEDVARIVRDLAEGFSVQSKYSNRLWLACIAAAAVLLFPKTSSDTVDLPFSLGAVPRAIFEPVGFGIVFILYMAFCQAYAHAHNAAIFGQRLLDKFERDSAGTDARDFYDILVTASFARVWPLVDLLRRLTSAPSWIVVPYYVVLKSLTHAFILGVPASALVFAYLHNLERSTTWIHVLALIALIFVIIAVIEIAFADFIYGWRVVARLRKA